MDNTQIFGLHAKAEITGEEPTNALEMHKRKLNDAVEEKIRYLEMAAEICDALGYTRSRNNVAILEEARQKAMKQAPEGLGQNAEALAAARSIAMHKFLAQELVARHLIKTETAPVNGL